jgi:DNA phosphorothioation-dependent restriction protein DptH
VKYRRHLRTARSPETLENVRRQVESLRVRWEEWYCSSDVYASFRAVRRAKLARVLRFYADKAYRHYLLEDQHDIITSEIDRMIEKGADYSFAAGERADRGWVFCPDYAGESPMEITPDQWDTRIFLFGPDLLPDSDFRRDPVARPPQEAGESSKPSASAESGGQELHGDLDNATTESAPTPNTERKSCRER